MREQLDLLPHDLRHGHRDACPAAVSQGRHQGVTSSQASRPAGPGDARVPAADEPSRADQSSDFGLWLLDLVGGPSGRALGRGDGRAFQRRSVAASAASGGILGSTSQAYDEGQTRRSRLPEGQRRADGLEKKALRKNAAEALVFQDEVEIHRHPTLTRMWAPIGVQPEIPAPGQNQKEVVYGGVDYATGKIIYTIAATKSGANFLAFLV